MNLIQGYDINTAINRVEHSIERRIDKHGRQPHATPHESLGICMEELYEVQKAIHENHEPAVIAKEFRDLAVAAIWAFLSLEKPQ